jgi:tetratricopeptide (TPR) repeat protein
MNILKMRKFIFIPGALAAVIAIFSIYAWRNYTVCRNGEGARAIASCSMVIKYVPINSAKVTSLNCRAAQYEKISLKNEALADLAASARLVESGGGAMSGDTLAPMYGRLAILNHKLTNDADVLKYADLAVQNGSTDPDVYMVRAFLNLGLDKNAEALADLQKSESLGYKQPQLYFNYASAYRGLGNYAKAYTLLKEAEPTMLTPDDMNRFNRVMGFTCFELRHYAESIAYLKKYAASGEVCQECVSAMALAEELARKQEEE